MYYVDDGITLDYDKLKNHYPAGKGWTRFLKNKQNKGKGDDFIYYGKHKGSNRVFNPPVITDAINITSRNFLPILGPFDEELAKQQNLVGQKDNEKTLLENELNVDGIVLLGKNIEGREKDGWQKKEDDEFLKESTHENSLMNGSNGGGEENSKEFNMMEDLETVHKMKRIKKTRLEIPVVKRGKKGKKWIRRGKKEKRTVFEAKGEKKEEQEDSYLINRIPSFLGEYGIENMYQINRMFCFDPTNPCL